MSVYDRLDWPEYLNEQRIKEFFWEQFSFEQKFLHSFGLLHIDTEGIREPGHRDIKERLRYFIFEEGVLFILSGSYPTETPYVRTEKIKISWIEASQIDAFDQYSLWLKSIEELEETRTFDWIGEPRPSNKRAWHEKTIVGMQVTRQHAVRDDLACYGFPADELPPESRAGTSQELWGLSLQFSLQGHSAYFAIEPLNRGFSGGDKFVLIAQDPAWYWSRKAEFYREARLHEYDGCMMQIIPGERPLYHDDLKGRECLMYGIQAHEFINSICYMYIREFSTLGINHTSAQQWYGALEFWIAMKESSSWEEVWAKVATPNYEQHTVDDYVMRFFNNHFTHPWGDEWEAVEYFFDWVATILPTCDTIIAEGL